MNLRISQQGGTVWGPVFDEFRWLGSGTDIVSCRSEGSLVSLTRLPGTRRLTLGITRWDLLGTRKQRRRSGVEPRRPWDECGRLVLEASKHTRSAGSMTNDERFSPKKATRPT